MRDICVYFFLIVDLRDNAIKVSESLTNYLATILINSNLFDLFFKLTFEDYVNSFGFVKNILLNPVIIY